MKLKYLAWDVGIKNLAYSIIEYNIDNNEKTIIDWGVINLMNVVGANEEEKKGLLCCARNNKGIKCVSKANYLFQNDNSIGLCGLHKNMKKYKTEKFIDLSIELICCYETFKKKENIVVKCSKKATFSVKDKLTLCYCNQHLKMIQKKENIEAIEIKKDKKDSVKGHSILDLSKSLYQHLDSLKDIMLNVDEIIIENQPVLKNPTMKTIQILLYSYFVLNGILKNTVKNISFFSASKKLDAFNDINNTLFNSVSHLSGQYQINKKLSILFTLEMIKNDPKWFAFFNKHQKKDDLADAYLTNCYFIDKKYKNNIEPIKNKTKKNTTKQLELEENLEEENLEEENLEENLEETNLEEENLEEENLEEENNLIYLPSDNDIIKDNDIKKSQKSSGNSKINEIENAIKAKFNISFDSNTKKEEQINLNNNNNHKKNIFQKKQNINTLPNINPIPNIDSIPNINPYYNSIPYINNIPPIYNEFNPYINTYEFNPIMMNQNYNPNQFNPYINQNEFNPYVNPNPSEFNQNTNEFNQNEFNQNQNEFNQNQNEFNQNQNEFNQNQNEFNQNPNEFNQNENKITSELGDLNFTIPSISKVSSKEVKKKI
jgi:hypothetical protein